MNASDDDPHGSMDEFMESVNVPRQKPPRFRRPQHGAFDPPRGWDPDGDPEDAAWREAERGLEGDPDDGDVPA